MKKDNPKIRLLIFIITSTIALNNFSSPSIKRNNNKKEIHNIITTNNKLNKTTNNDFYQLILDDFNINKEKEIKNTLNYLYYCLRKTENNNYYEYLASLTGEYLSVDISNSMVPQGITQYKNYTIISAYNENRLLNSYIYVIDEFNNLINKVELDNNSHVGGIAYDDDNKLLWVTVKNKLYGYIIDDIITKEKVYKKYKTYGLDKNLNCSFLTYKNQKLYIGNYNDSKESVIKVYKLKKSKIKNQINFIPKKTLKIPRRIQGIDFITINKKEYLLLSSSYYIFENSKIYFYKYNDNKTNYTNNYISLLTCPPMIEEIKITNNNELLALYESNSNKYQDCLININHIYYSNIKRKIKTIKRN